MPLAFLQAVASMPGLRLRGLLSHAGHGYSAASEDELADIAREEAEMLTALRDRAAASGIALDEVSVGATPTLRFSAQQRGLTELRPGNYVYFDRTQVALGAASLDDCALTVLATVVSKPAADRIILDCGSKTLTNDQARGIDTAPGFGAVLRRRRRAGPTTLLIERLSEEHATVRVTSGTQLEARRSRARRAQSLVRRVEPGGCGAAGRGRRVMDTIRSRRGTITRTQRSRVEV